VILADTGEAERMFATLAEAVIRAGSGDTIEVRGDGPFTCAAVPLIEGRRLIIRAGAGARPVLRLDASPKDGRPLLSTDSDLILEGLELQPLLTGWSSMVLTNDRTRGGRVTDPSLYVANCRFRIPPALDVTGRVSVV